MTNRFLYLMATLAFGAGMAGAGEEHQPLMPGPGAYAHNEIGPGTSVSATRRISSNNPDGGRQRPQLRQNVVKLTLPPAPVKQPSRLRMVEATESGPDGTLTFQPTQTLPGTRHADIPGLVPPEVLALTHIQQINNSGGRTRAPAPLRLPQTLGTEELVEFDPTSVSKTGDPFRDTPGFAEVFPAATTHSQVLGPRTIRYQENRPKINRSLPETGSKTNRQANSPAAAREFPSFAPQQPQKTESLRPLEPLAPTEAPQPIQLPAPLEPPPSALSSKLFELPEFPDALKPATMDEEEPAAAKPVKPAFLPPPLETPQQSQPIQFIEEAPTAPQFSQPVRPPEPLTASRTGLPFQTLEPLETLPLPQPVTHDDAPLTVASTPKNDSLPEPEPPALAYMPPPPAPLPELPMPKVSSPLPRPAERTLRPSQSPSAVAPPAEAAMPQPNTGLGISSSSPLLAPPVETRPSAVKQDAGKGLSLRPPPRQENEEPVPLVPLTQSQGIILHPGERVIQPPVSSITGSGGPMLTGSMPLTASYPVDPGAGMSVTGPHPETGPRGRRPPPQGSLSESVAVKEADSLTPMRGLKIY